MKFPNPRKIMFHIGRFAPDVLPVIGAALCVASPIVAAIETHKHYDEILKDKEERLKKAEEAEKEAEDKGEPTTEKQKKSIRLYNKMVTILKFAKIYILPGVMAIAGVAMLFYGKIHYKKTYLSTSESLVLATAELNDIKSRANELLSKDDAKAVVDGVRKDIVTLSDTDEDGNTTEVTGSRYILGRKLVSNHPTRIGTYTFVVDSRCKGTWMTDPGRTLDNIRSVQWMMNDLLIARGFVYLNEVLEKLHEDLVPDGYTVGWSKLAGCNFIDFGLNSPDEKMNVALINHSGEYNNCCVLDFNCVGDIRNKMYRYQLTDNYSPLDTKAA